MKPRLIILLAVFSLAIILIYTWCNKDKKVSVLVVTGGHAFDTSAFFEMFQDLEGINTDTVEYSRIHQTGMEKLIRNYNVLLFYDMWQKTSEADKQLLSLLTDNGTGLVFLHHSLASHPGWQEYQHIIGGRYRPRTEPDSVLRSAYKHDLDLRVSILDPDHPVTSGISDFKIHDEGYSNISILPDVYPLLATKHPDAAQYLAWANNYQSSRIVYLMLGHDQAAYNNESFKKLLQNAIHYVSD